MGGGGGGGGGVKMEYAQLPPQLLNVRVTRETSGNRASLTTEIEKGDR